MNLKFRSMQQLQDLKTMEIHRLSMFTTSITTTTSTTENIKANKVKRSFKNKMFTAENQAMAFCSCPYPHTRLECSGSSCWNCNDHHIPLPILTPQQLELTQLGFNFGQRYEVGYEVLRILDERFKSYVGMADETCVEL